MKNTQPNRYSVILGNLGNTCDRFLPTGYKDSLPKQVMVQQADNIIRAQTDGTLGQYAEAIRQIAGEEKTYLADVHREWENLAGDGLDTDVWLVNGLNHPDHRGHKLACSIVLNEILFIRP
jgi:xylose isomerase